MTNPIDVVSPLEDGWVSLPSRLIPRTQTSANEAIEYECEYETNRMNPPSP